MVNRDPVSIDILPFVVSQKAIEALERLRKSYMGLLAEEPVTEADQAVLKAVETILNNAKSPSRLV